jgi:hypothetical protein
MDKRWHGKESRWGERSLVNVPVEISANGLTSMVGRLKNLSLSGALVKADGDLGLHSLVQVLIARPSASQSTSRSPAASQLPMPISAYVSRKATEGIGVEWCEFGPSVVKELLRSPEIP